MNVKEYARRFAKGEIRTKQEANVQSQVERYAAKHTEARATAKPERPKREERATWQATEE